MYLDPFYFLFWMISSRQNHPICYLQLETLHTGEIFAPSAGGLKDRSQHRKHDWALKGTEEARRWGLRTSNDRLGTSWGTGNSLLLPLVLWPSNCPSQASLLYLSYACQPRMTRGPPHQGMMGFGGHRDREVQGKLGQGSHPPQPPFWGAS